MMSTRTYLSIVTDSAALYPTRAVFKIPTVAASGSEFHAWKGVTYAQFVDDIGLYAQFWGHKLTSGGIPAGEIIGLWYVHATHSNQPSC